MTITPDIVSFDATPTSLINGASTTYDISVVSPIPLLNTDRLVFTLPSEVTPTTPSPLCSTLSNVLTVTCTRSGQEITAALTFTGSTLAANTEFKITLNGVTNPPSTKPSSVFSWVYLEDASSGQLS
jgi:hypothetical protein